MSPGARARSGGGNGAADRGKRSGGGNGAAGGNGHHDRRGSSRGRSFRDDSRRPSKRVGFSSRPTPRPHTNVFVPEQGDDAAVRQIVQANSAAPHFVGAAITSAQDKELMESPPTVSRKQLAAQSDSDLMITFTSSDDDEHEKEEEYSETDIGIFGPDSSSSDNDATKHDDDDDIESSDHDDQQEEEAQALTADDQEEAQTLTAHDDLIAAASVMNDMLDAEWRQQMQQESLQADEVLKNKMQGLFDFSKKQFITLPEYKKDTKFAFDISPKLCDHLYDNTVSPEQVCTVLANTHNDYLVQLQATMKERFNRLDFEPEHELQIITYANFINNQIQKRTSSTTFWITLVPWSKLAWLWSDKITAPPDPPDPPDIPEVSLDEAHAAFAATLPALTVSDTACAQVDATAAAFANSVSHAINIASEAASAINHQKN
jgi:hypothetical protein